MLKRVLWLFMILAVLAAGYSLWTHRFGVPEDFADMESQYKYGSIGSDHPLSRAPLPYWIWKALPELFPPSAAIEKSWYEPRNDKQGYAAFGLVTEAVMARPRGYTDGQPVFERPIGFSRRKVFGMDFVGINCALCHLTTLRQSPADKAPQVILGGTGNAVDIEQYFRFLFSALSADVLKDTGKVMNAVLKQNKDMSFLQQIAYRYVVIPYIRYRVVELKKEFDFINPHRLDPPPVPDFGPGRVDTWAGYKTAFLDPDQRDKLNGIVDFPPIWNQGVRTGMRLHWDGNTDVLDERNIISALALIGSRLDYLDVPRLTRISEYITWLVPPQYAAWAPTDPIPLSDKAKAALNKAQEAQTERGKVLFERDCAACHAAGSLRVGRVEPIADLGTDPLRIHAFTDQLASALNQLQTDVWKLRNFRPQNGYANTLLDGIWLRGPYLHNGSVPTLRDLLKTPAERPKKFCRGTDVYNRKDVGFVSAVDHKNPARPCGEFFLYDTEIRGNGNQGHTFGTTLSERDKDALLEFLKGL